MWGGDEGVCSAGWLGEPPYIHGDPLGCKFTCAGCYVLTCSPVYVPGVEWKIKTCSSKVNISH